MSDAEDIKALRAQLGWTQGKLGQYLGLDASAVSRIEAGGGTRGPTRRLLDILAAEVAAGKTGDELLPEAAE